MRRLRDDLEEELDEDPFALPPSLSSLLVSVGAPICSDAMIMADANGAASTEQKEMAAIAALAPYGAAIANDIPKQIALRGAMKTAAELPRISSTVKSMTSKIENPKERSKVAMALASNLMGNVAVKYFPDVPKHVREDIGNSTTGALIYRSILPIHETISGSGRFSGGASFEPDVSWIFNESNGSGQLKGGAIKNQELANQFFKAIRPAITNWSMMTPRGPSEREGENPVLKRFPVLAEKLESILMEWRPLFPDWDDIYEVLSMELSNALGVFNQSDLDNLIEPIINTVSEKLNVSPLNFTHEANRSVVQAETTTGRIPTSSTTESEAHDREIAKEAERKFLEGKDLTPEEIEIARRVAEKTTGTTTTFQQYILAQPELAAQDQIRERTVAQMVEKNIPKPLQSVAKVLETNPYAAALVQSAPLLMDQAEAALTPLKDQVGSLLSKTGSKIVDYFWDPDPEATKKRKEEEAKAKKKEEEKMKKMTPEELAQYKTQKSIERSKRINEGIKSVGRWTKDLFGNIWHGARGLADAGATLYLSAKAASQPELENRMAAQQALMRTQRGWQQKASDSKEAIVKGIGTAATAVTGAIAGDAAAKAVAGLTNAAADVAGADARDRKAAEDALNRTSQPYAVQPLVSRGIQQATTGEKMAAENIRAARMREEERAKLANLRTPQIEKPTPKAEPSAEQKDMLKKMTDLQQTMMAALMAKKLGSIGENKRRYRVEPMKKKAKTKKGKPVQIKRKETKLIVKPVSSHAVKKAKKH